MTRRQSMTPSRPKVPRPPRRSATRSPFATSSPRWNATTARTVSGAETEDRNHSGPETRALPSRKREAERRDRRRLSHHHSREAPPTRFRRHLRCPVRAHRPRHHGPLIAATLTSGPPLSGPRPAGNGAPRWDQRAPRNPGASRSPRPPDRVREWALRAGVGRRISGTILVENPERETVLMSSLGGANSTDTQPPGAGRAPRNARQVLATLRGFRPR